MSHVKLIVFTHSAARGGGWSARDVTAFLLSGRKALVSHLCQRRPGREPWCSTHYLEIWNGGLGLRFELLTVDLRGLGELDGCIAANTCN